MVTIGSLCLLCYTHYYAPYRVVVSADITKLVGKVHGVEGANLFEEIVNMLGGNWTKVSTFP